MEDGWVVFFVGLFIFLVVMFFVQQNQISDYRAALQQANDAIQTADSNIDTANENIDDVNSTITDAQGDAWSDYDTMGDDIDNLKTADNIETVDTVPDPHPKSSN